MDSLHRIEPRLLTVPQFYGSPGEPQLGSLPKTYMPSMSSLQPTQPSIGGMVSLAALAAMLGSGKAEAPTGIGSLFNTELKPNEEGEFQAWKQMYAPRDSGEDYDLRGAFKAGVVPDPKSGHWPDTFKKPNHPTFSVESMYAEHGNPGRWKGEEFIAPLTLASLAQQVNVRSVSGKISRPEKKLRFDDLSFGKAFALARRIGLDQFTWNGNPYTTKLK